MLGFFKGKENWAIKLAYIQGVFYFVAGLWPILDIGTFMIASGPKTDLWLVRTVGAMIACTGLVLLLAARTREVNRPIALLAASNAVALTLVDIIYVAAKVIPPIYLVDAVIEVVLVAGWIMLWPEKSAVNKLAAAQRKTQPLNRFDREVELSDGLA